MAHPNLNKVEFLTIKTRGDEIENLEYQTEKHDHGKVLESLKRD